MRRISPTHAAALTEVGWTWVMTTNPAEQIALWSDQWRDLSAMTMGLFFAKSVHDEIAYRDGKMKSNPPRRWVGLGI
jgi:hypothetical protein